MPTNIEIKARAYDPERQAAIAASLATEPAQQFNQIDTFFHVTSGRLKLRQLSEKAGQLIHYQREDLAGPKSSDYSIFTTTSPDELRKILSDSLGIRGEVRKKRTLYLVNQTRIHFDRVEQLGSFIELEVMLRPTDSLEQCKAVANDLMLKLGIQPADLIDHAYLDMILAGH